MLVKLMSGVSKELLTNKQPWLAPELKSILKSLESKLERKIMMDVEQDFSKVAEMNLTHVGCSNADWIKPCLKVEKIIKNCLALIKYLQYEGDIEFTNNSFHKTIMENIGEIFENKEDMMHFYSKNLLRLIQNEKGVRTKKQEFGG